MSCEYCKYQHLDEDEEPCVKCSHAYVDKFEPMPQPTNADYIRKMTDEELAKLLTEPAACRACEYHDKKENLCKMPDTLLCTKGYAEALILKWLQQECEVKNDNKQ